MNSADNATAEARFAQGTRPVARRKFLVSSGAATLGLGLIMQPHRMMAADPAVPGSGQQWKIKMKVITFRDTATAATPAEQAQDGETKVFNNPVLAPITNTLPAAPVVPAIPTPTNPVDLNAPVQTTTTWIIVKNGAAPTRTRYTVNRQERTVQGVTFVQVNIGVTYEYGGAAPDSGMSTTYPDGKEYPPAQIGTPGSPPDPPP